MYDVMIIGAGVTGSAIARELMRKKRNIAVLERCSDICEGTSKANSGIVHAGFDATPGTLKAKMNVQGSRMMEALSKELDFSYKRNGSLVLCFNEADRPKLELLLEKAEKNGVEGCEIISGDEVRRMEPQVSEQVVAALYAPAGGIVCPFGLTIALAENACTNGAEFLLNQEVQKIVKKDGYYEIHTQDHVYETKLVVNAAGVYADVFHNMVSEHKIQIIPRKGEYCLLDKKVGDFVSHTIFQLPTKYGKGVLVTPTVHGNLMLGPTAVDESDKENIATTAEGLEDLQQRALLSTPNLPKRQTITSFAGLRAHTEKNDFIIEEVADAPGFIDVHTHGAAGVDVNAADEAGLRRIAAFFATQGVTAFNASVLTDTPETTEKCLGAIANVMSDRGKGAQLLGAHLEGPFLAREYKGAMPENLLREGDENLLRAYQNKYPGVIRYITVSPEVPDVVEMIGKISHDVVVAIGHSGADYDTSMEAIRRGARCVTHTFNAMRLFHQHQPAIMGAALESDCWCEAIWVRCRPPKVPLKGGLPHSV